MAHEMPLDLAFALIVAAIGAIWLLAVVLRSPRHEGCPASLWQSVETLVALFLVIGMALSCGGQVIVRYAFSEYVTLYWTEELARLLMVWTAMWGAAVLQRSDDHIRMTVLVDILPQRLQRVIDLLGDVVVLVVLGIIAWFGWITAWRLRVMSTVSLGVPISAFALAVSLGVTIMLGHTLRNLLRRLRQLTAAQTDLMNG